MAKRKITTEVSLEAISIQLKKAKTSVSKYSLLSKSKQLINSDKEEIDQQVCEFEKTTELNLLLDHLTDENAGSIETFIKKCIKEDKAKKTKHFRYTCACLQETFRYMLKNVEKLSEISIEKLSKCFTAGKIEIFSCDKLNEFLEMFVVHTGRIKRIDSSIAKIISSIAKEISISKVSTSLVHSMFYEILLTTCNNNDNNIKPLEQTQILISLLNILNNTHHFGADERRAELVMNTIFEQIQPKDATTTTKTTTTYIKSEENRDLPIFLENCNKQQRLGVIFCWSIDNVKELLDSISIVNKYVPRLRQMVLEGLIQLVIYCKKSLTEKTAYKQLEILAIDLLTKDLHTDTKKKRLESGIAFRQAFIAIIKKNSMKAILNRFFIGLYLTSVDFLETPNLDLVHRAFLDATKSIFEKQLHAKQSIWLENCMVNANPVDELNNLFVYRKLLLVMPEALVLRSLLSVCRCIMENYIHVEMSKNATVAANPSDFFSQFVSRNLTQLFCKAKKPFEPAVITDLLSDCFSNEKSQGVFINQLTLLLANKQVDTLMNDNDNAELEKLRKSVATRLVGASKYASIKSVYKHLHQFPTFESAIRLLDTLSHILFWTKPDQLTLIVKGFVSINTPCSKDDTQRLSVYALLSILKSINTIPTVIFPVKHLEGNQRISELIIESLKLILTRTEKTSTKSTAPEASVSIIAELKSATYQTFNAIIRINDKLIIPIVAFLMGQLKKVLINIVNYPLDEAYFDLTKCVSSNFNSNLHLIEPCDVLLHCSDLCARMALKKVYDDHMHPAYKPLIEIKKICQSIFNTYELKSSLELFEIYKKQTNGCVIQQISPAKSMLVLHKLVMGLIDVGIEHVVTEQQYTKILKMFDHHESTSNLISIDIEALMNYSIKQQQQRTNTLSSSLKRKFEPPKAAFETASIIKKFRLSLMPQTDKSENPPTTSANAGTTSSKQRKPFTDITNTGQPALLVAKTEPLTPILAEQKSYITMQFTHVSRISYTCCVKMLQLIQCSDDKGTEDLHKLFADYSNRNALLSVLTNKKFAEYVLKVIERKMKALLSDELREEIYDPEGQTEKGVFEFLSKLWDNMWQRVNGTINDSGTSAFTTMCRQLFSQTFFVKTLKFTVSCQTIWTIVQTKFQSHSAELIANERRTYVPPNAYISFDSDAKKKAHKNFCWMFLLNCANTVKLYLAPVGPKQVYASKCCSSMLNLMLDIMKTVELTSIEYENVYQWLCGLSSMSIACEIDAYKSIINFLIYLESKRGSQAIIIKYLMMDYHQYKRLMMADSNDEDSEDSDPTDMTTQFQLCGAFNSENYQKLVLDKMIDLLAEFKWVIRNYSSNDFHGKKLLRVILKQLEPVILGINNAIESIFNLESIDAVVNVLIVFYDFMKSLFESDLLKDLNCEEKEVIKDLLESISSRIRLSLSDQWPSIREFIINEEESHEEKKVDMNDFHRFSKYKMLISNLEMTISCFEEAIKKLNNCFKDVNLLEGYRVFVDSLKLNFNCKVTRTISISQIDNYCYHQPTGGNGATNSSSQDRREF